MGKGGRRKYLHELTAYLTWAKVGEIPIWCARNDILAHRIRTCTSEFLHGIKIVILSRLSQETVHWLYWNSVTWSSSDANVQSKRCHHVIMHLSVFRDFWKLILNWYSQLWARKESIILCEGGIEYKNTSWVWGWDRKIHPKDHWLASWVLPGDDKLWSRGMFFYYPILSPVMDYVSCSPLDTSFYIEKREKDFQKILNTLRCDMVTSF